MTCEICGRKIKKNRSKGRELWEITKNLCESCYIAYLLGQVTMLEEILKKTSLMRYVPVPYPYVPFPYTHPKWAVDDKIISQMKAEEIGTEFQKELRKKLREVEEIFKNNLPHDPKRIRGE